MSSSDESDSLSLGSDFKFRAYAALVALGAAVVITVCLWRLYKCARSPDVLPVTAGKAALTQKDIAALPVFVHGGAAEECAVCLSEMKDGEKGRLLPGCGHRFHVDCIDRWFRANSTCPLCRAAAVGKTGAVEAHKGGSAVVPVAVVQD